MPPKPDRIEQQPGADRFWGQFSQSKAGRSSSGEADSRSDGESRAGDGSPHDAHCLEWCPICRSAELFRTTVSPELRQQAESIQHEAMGVLKAFLEAYAEKSAGESGASSSRGEPGARSEAPEGPATPRVTDIPLD